ncbi:hypothetical protein SeMB42_g03298 [Synchytrium endobioticum]|uniref:Kinesin-like protein n=1 Tax=Synchytrium endobioticum TaxID=286115 RepID=A0A507DCI4_9FUNG|nr:hypothetical protein SeMB42_g03298 [Synchytrium endobioticum]TPX49304.1 hypothetical protein SeLEV6574_g01562 [Synchytrium endobioticum]
MASENIRVIVRCRPFNDREKQAGHKRVIDIDPKAGCVLIKSPATTTSSTSTSTATPSKDAASSSTQDNPDCKTFAFDGAFGEDSIQADVYNKTARFIVDEVLKGFNGTVFAYGQTGTGKTFTMQGVRDVPTLRGIIPSTFNHIFNHISLESTSKQYLVRCSYIEIYNEEIRDLLVKTPPGKKPPALDLKEHPETGVYVKDLTSYVVKSVQEMDALIDIGNGARAVGATLMNAESSRSHSIFTITVESSETVELPNGAGKEERLVAGKLHLVDLAGSERQGKTGATGERLKEATKINLSLSALGNCISALVDGKSTHIPYRDSKLTRLLQDSLGGNSKTLMIATLSPASYNYDETLSTLRYANRAKNIKNKPKINEDPKDAMLREYQDEIKKLREQLERKKSGRAPPSVKYRPLNSSIPANDGEDEDVESGSEASDNEASHQPTSPSSSQKHGKHGNSFKDMGPEAISRLQQQVEEERLQLIASKSVAHAEKQRLITELENRALELQREKAEGENLAIKLKSMEDQLLVGGVSIADRVSAQQKQLEVASRKIEAQAKAEKEIRAKLELKQEATLQLEEHYNNLQDEVDTKTKKLKKLWSRLEATRREVTDLQDEFRSEREELLETIRDLSRELLLKQAVAANFIPPEEISKVESRCVFDEETDEWGLTHTIAEFHQLNRLERPLAQPSLKRPVSGLAKARMIAGDPNPRWRVDNLLSLGLDTTNLKTTFSSNDQMSYDAKPMDLDVGELYRDSPSRNSSTGLLSSSGPVRVRGGLNCSRTGSALGSEDFDSYHAGSEDLSSAASPPSSKHPSNTILNASLPPSREVLRALAPGKQRKS